MWMSCRWGVLCEQPNFEISKALQVCVNTSFSVLHFSEDEIVSNADKIGVSLGENSREIAKSVNDLLDLEADRAMDMLRNIAVVKPMNDNEVNELGFRSLECFCDDVIPPSVLDREALEVEEHATPLQPNEGLGNNLSHADSEVVLDKPKRTKEEGVPFSTVRRSMRTKFKQKIHDEK
jgi:hypothetical protein